MLVEIEGRPSQAEGMYSLGNPPKNLAPHNLRSFSIVAAMLANGESRDYWDLAVAVMGHRSGTAAARATAAASFIRYCAKSGWIVKTGEQKCVN